MWSFHSEQLLDNHGMRFVVDLDSQPASFADVVGAWTDAPSFRSLFNAQLADIPYTAFRWDMRSTCPARRTVTSSKNAHE